MRHHLGVLEDQFHQGNINTLEAVLKVLEVLEVQLLGVQFVLVVHQQDLEIPEDHLDLPDLVGHQQDLEVLEVLEVQGVEVQQIQDQSELRLK